MKTEIVYDGEILQKRLCALKNLSELVSTTNMETEQRMVEKMIQDRDRFVQEVKGAHVYLDVCVQNTYYEWIVVGNFGLVANGDVRVPAFKQKSNRFYIGKDAQFVNGLRTSLFKTYQYYEDLVNSIITKPRVSDIIGAEYELDFDKFCNSDLWTQLKYARDAEAKRLNVEPHLLFKQREAFEYIRLFPSDVDTSSQIEVPMQRKILVGWKYFLQRKQ